MIIGEKYAWLGFKKIYVIIIISILCFHESTPVMLGIMTMMQLAMICCRVEVGSMSILNDPLLRVFWISFSIFNVSIILFSRHLLFDKTLQLLYFQNLVSVIACMLL